MRHSKVALVRRLAPRTSYTLKTITETLCQRYRVTSRTPVTELATDMHEVTPGREQGLGLPVPSWISEIKVGRTRSGGRTLRQVEMSDAMGVATYIRPPENRHSVRVHRMRFNGRPGVAGIGTRKTRGWPHRRTKSPLPHRFADNLRAVFLVLLTSHLRG